jgi:hypothetical protein
MSVIKVMQLRRQMTHLLGLLSTAVEERDEARREVCALFVAGDFSVHENVTKEQVALERGWDCFMDETDNTSEDL